MRFGSDISAIKATSVLVRAGYWDRNLRTICRLFGCVGICASSFFASTRVWLCKKRLWAAMVFNVAGFSATLVKSCSRVPYCAIKPGCKRAAAKRPAICDGVSTKACIRSGNVTGLAAT